MSEKYPWIKRIFKKSEPMKCVYAGPEKMERRGDIDVDEPHVDPASGVYAGPEFFGISTGRVYAGPEPRPEPDMPVYAGPEFFGGGQPTSSGGEKSDGFDFDDDPGMNDVYAGPEFFENAPGDEPEEDEQVPEEEVLSDEIKPIPFSPQDIDSKMFMTVYAGPEFFSSDPNPPAGVYVPNPPPSDDTPRLRICPACLRDIPEGSKFCPKCGAALSTEEKEEQREGMIRCPSCGLFFPENSKFCTECGTPKKTGDGEE